MFAEPSLYSQVPIIIAVPLIAKDKDYVQLIK